MKRLGALILPNSIQWSDRDSWSPVKQTALQTLSGRVVLHPTRQITGRPITLLAEKSVTWLTQSEIDALKAMAAQPGATFELHWLDDPVRVVTFRHHDPPAVAFQPIFPHTPPYTGEIRLVEI
ncbi:hypothetical protein SIID45300_01064 [Candidatus Magnetaquicoccaceae bacterium FCR-1]|uniref:Uncharacterized protein n=1 Tax=Candidatus Magnetaquiglobus chichijimensis TaxID=3141448 RepID=A0ABQ0C795_9PROT